MMAPKGATCRKAAHIIFAQNGEILHGAKGAIQNDKRGF